MKSVIFVEEKCERIPNGNGCPMSIRVLCRPTLNWPTIQTLNTNLKPEKTRINFTVISFLSLHITFNSIFMILNKENKNKVLLQRKF
jgi:hypothetical protein